VAEADKTYTAAEVDALVKDSLAKAKADGDTAFGKLWEEAKSAKERAKLFDGLDPAEARAAKARIVELEQSEKAKKAGITSEQLDKMRNDIRQDLEKDYSPFKSKAETLAAENRGLKLDTKVKDVFGKNGVRAERIEALFKLEGDKFDLTDDGAPILKGRMGTPIEKFVVEDLSKQYPEFFVGTGSSGGGASRSNVGGGGSRTVQNTFEDFTANINKIAAGEVTMKVDEV
jgi:hypothetical protein